MTIVYTNKEDAISAAPLYAREVRDDVYVRRHAGGREFRLWTRTEMVEFQSDYIEYFHKYSPSERSFNAFRKFLKENGVSIDNIKLDGNKLVIEDYDSNTYIVSVTKQKRDEDNND